MCPVSEHGTTSRLPPFLHRCLQYLPVVVERGVEGMILEGKSLEDLVELDGPCEETLQRWNVSLTSVLVREQILLRLPSGLIPTKEDRKHLKAEQAYTWKAACTLRDYFGLKITFVTRFLQLLRLSLMKRYRAI
jgi:hypothetical protein